MRRSLLLRRCLLLVVILLASSLLAQQVVRGALDDGSLYEFQVPNNWNGSLVLYAHGYVDPAAPVALPGGAEFTGLRDTLVSLGYAVGYSGYADNGWAVKSGITDTHALRGIFAAKYRQPKRTYLVGVSLGSLVVTNLAEKYPTQYSGVLSMCGIMGGAPQQVNYIANARLLYDLFFTSGKFGTFSYKLPGDAAHPVTLPFSPGDPAFTGVTSNLVEGFAAAPYFPTLQYVATADIPGVNPGEIIAGSLSALWFDVRGGADLLARTHDRLPFDNQETVYHDSLTPALDPLINTFVARYQAAPDAVRYLYRYYQPTGDIRIPMYTLHTTRDPIVPVWHEDIYARMVALNGKSANLYQQRVNAFGHCAFAPTDVLGAFTVLTNWVKTGVRPQ